VRRHLGPASGVSLVRSGSRTGSPAPKPSTIFRRRLARPYAVVFRAEGRCPQTLYQQFAPLSQYRVCGGSWFQNIPLETQYIHEICMCYTVL